MILGSELDAQIAEKVFGWKKIYRKDYPDSGDWRGLDWMWDKNEGALYWTAQFAPKYSTDISIAWTVIEKLKETHPHLYFQLHENKGTGERYIAQFHDFNVEEQYQGQSNNVAHAICLAALKVCNGEDSLKNWRE